MNEEVMKVLRMLEDGKIDAGKAQELIEALTATKKIVPTTGDNIDKMLKIKVNSSTGDNVEIVVE